MTKTAKAVAKMKDLIGASWHGQDTYITDGTSHLMGYETAYVWFGVFSFIRSTLKNLINLFIEEHIINEFGDDPGQ